mmetsp:Transcript_24359/g.64044  ORF Transcript_24359/g.64044 Transcript_24359/m.64044 type:complete len:278 (+) Transcript_24359:201-1034(+)
MVIAIENIFSKLVLVVLVRLHDVAEPTSNPTHKHGTAALIAPEPVDDLGRILISFSAVLRQVSSVPVQWHARCVARFLPCRTTTSKSQQKPSFGDALDGFPRCSVQESPFVDAWVQRLLTPDVHGTSRLYGCEGDISPHPQLQVPLDGTSCCHVRVPYRSIAGALSADELVTQRNGCLMCGQTLQRASIPAVHSTTAIPRPVVRGLVRQCEQLTKVLQRVGVRHKVHPISPCPYLFHVHSVPLDVTQRHAGVAALVRQSAQDLLIFVTQLRNFGYVK